MSGHGMGGLKAQLLLSAQGIALGLSEFVFLPPCKGKSSTDSVVLEKTLPFGRAFALSGRTAIGERPNPGRCPGLKATVGLSARL